MSEQQPLRRIALVGFGEVGTIFGRDLARQGLAMSTYDILLDAPATRPAMVERARAAAVTPLDTLGEAVRGADLVISAVTASSSRDVARDAAAWLQPGQLFLDVNSVSPETKRGNARSVEASGADYVEAAMMAPVPPQRLAVPMLLGGRRANALAAALKAFGMNTTAVAAEMREVALTLEDVGVRLIMAAAAAERQDALVRQIAEAGVPYPAGGLFSWRALADALAAAGPQPRSR
jgi:3-hydroxyisobutyrate dehydrogenase-like beta-hydroxyacid dehydrogenase